MKQILIVDDDPGVQDAFLLVFDPQMYHVTILPNGHSILNEDASIPDLYILDKQLSGVDGLDICVFLKSKEASRNVPVIMISASPNIYKQAQAAGADGALEKPFKLRILRDLVQQHLGSR